MQDIPFISSGYKFMVTEAPTVKMREDDNGDLTPAVDKRTGEIPYVVMLFAKPRPVEGQRSSKGEEIKVTVTAEPGDEITEGSYVELVNPVLNTWQTVGKDGRISGSGLWFKAHGLKPAGLGAAQSAA